MGSKMNSQFLRMSIAAGVIAVAMAGCTSHYSGDNFPPQGAAMVRGNFPPPGAAMVNGKPYPPPRVQDCTMIQSSSPTKYVCNGKVYTTFDLNRMRMAYEKEQAAGL
jgi:hypothetical protein